VDPDEDPPQLPEAWTTWKIWQHGYVDPLPGSKGKVDFDVFNGDLTAFEKWIAESIPIFPLIAIASVGAILMWNFLK
jgi:GH25 family lysozyme M1 (1,4-beta-N-acetylmuramidase)